jgi:tRNA(His) guanylyltransferase
LIPNCYIVIRIDGKGFHKFTKSYDYKKPNDKRGLDLMAKCAEIVMTNFQDIILSYGQSDEFSFLLRRDS